MSPENAIQDKYDSFADAEKFYKSIKDWYKCDHDWRVPVDPASMCEVRCSKCGCYGDENLETGEVFWPAT